MTIDDNMWQEMTKMTIGTYVTNMTENEKNVNKSQ